MFKSIINFLFSFPLIAATAFVTSCALVDPETDGIKSRQQALEERLIALEGVQFEISQKMKASASKPEENKSASNLNSMISSNSEDIKSVRTDLLAVTNGQEAQQQKISELQERLELVTKRLGLLELEIDALRSSWTPPAKTSINNVPPSSSEEDEKKIIKEATDKFDSQDFEQSQTLFKSYIAKYPKGSFLDKSYYHSGQINFSKGDYNGASSDLWEVVRRFPQSPLFADAQWLLAVSLERGTNLEQAKELYKQIAQQPNSKHAKKAELRLQILSQ